ncbi:hypothetical protein [Neobacillus mesonae]|uniref:YqgU-like 6-bladed beta-propeller domain-containing protein n=1 Tax=Neobacillus mesonae TaxID=1193713 RepID=A0A3T0I1U3_9BACI|nr:hypothetical protein [Neobacillus mesonae]AZU63314.1 hypothetical protein CHR53_19735 [Neobacillus mesonae]
MAIFLILFSQLISACSHKEQPKQKPAASGKPNNASPAKVRGWKLPISISEGEFYKIAGWLSDTEILYITNLQQASNVYRYDLISGKSELIYRSDHPIVTIQLSPTKKYLLVHSAPSSYEGEVTILDTKGNAKLKKSIASYDLVFEWNPYNESEILVSKFNEDWSFQIMLIDIKKSTTTDIPLPQPFIKWLTAKQIAFINWDHEQPALAAPLIKKDLANGNQTNLFQDVIQFTAFRDLLMTVTINEQESSKANYSFYENGMKKLWEFTTPQLSNYSDWLMPFFDYNDATGQFITLQPLSSGEADSYDEGFNLMEYDIKTQKQRKILEGLDNEPIAISPSGKSLLYGNSFEKIINLQEKKIYQALAE